MKKLLNLLWVLVFQTNVFATSNFVPIEAEQSTDLQILHQASLGVVRISNKLGDTSASGFFIDQNTLITNFHVLKGLLKDINNNLSLEQKIENSKHYRLKKAYKEKKISRLDLFSIAFQSKNNHLPVTDEKIRITKIKHLSAIDDLAILEVKGYKGSYLHLGSNPVPGDNKNYFLIGYPRAHADDKVFERKNTIIKNRVVDRIDSQYISISYNGFLTYHGMSGGPLINQKGEVAGIHSYGVSNTISGESVQTIKSLLSQPELPHNKDIQHLISNEMKALKTLTDDSFQRKKLRESGKARFILSLRENSVDYVNMEKSAEMYYPLAVLSLSEDFRDKAKIQEQILELIQKPPFSMKPIASLMIQNLLRDSIQEILTKKQKQQLLQLSVAIQNEQRKEYDQIKSFLSAKKTSEHSKLLFLLIFNFADMNNIINYRLDVIKDAISANYQQHVLFLQSLADNTSLKTTAYFLLGKHYLLEESDYNKAFRKLLKAAEYHPIAQYFIVTLIDTGVLDKQKIKQANDFSFAFENLIRSADGGYPPAVKKLTILLEANAIKLKQGTKYRRMIQLLKVIETPESLLKIASFYERGVEGEVQKSPRQIFRWLKKAAKKVHPSETYDNFIPNESTIEAAGKLRELSYSTHQKKQKRGKLASCRNTF